MPFRNLSVKSFRSAVSPSVQPLLCCKSMQRETDISEMCVLPIPPPQAQPGEDKMKQWKASFVMPCCSTAEKFSSAWLLSWCWVLFWCIWTIHIYLWLFLIQVTWTTVRQGFSGSVRTQLCISDQCQLCSLAQAGPKTWNGSWGLDVGSVLVPADGEPLPSALGSQEEVVGRSCSSLHAGALIQAPLQECMGTRGTDAPAHLDLLKPNAYFPIQISLETVKSPGSAEWGRKALSEEGGGLSSLVPPTSKGVCFKLFPA